MDREEFLMRYVLARAGTVTDDFRAVDSAYGAIKAYEVIKKNVLENAAKHAKKDE